MKHPERRLHRCGSVFLLILAIMGASGCGTTHWYSPGQAPMYQIPTRTLDLQSLNVPCSIAVFESGHLAQVDVENNIDVIYNCQLFGRALRDDLASELLKTGRFTQVSRAETVGQVHVRGRVDSITVKNNMGVWGPGPSATGTVSYAIGCAACGIEPEIRDSVHVEVLYPKKAAPFCLAIDALRLQLAHDIALRIAESERLPEIAAVARSKGDGAHIPTYSETPGVIGAQGLTTLGRPSLHSPKEPVTER